uniref:Uncharacterized protein n=1 Tax=Ditylenchus dipsaci TaxID=166011 RepID=A0A915EJR0_9BILA
MPIKPEELRAAFVYLKQKGSVSGLLLISSTFSQEQFRRNAHRNVVFSDEKIFTLEQAHNRQNDRVWMPKPPQAEDRIVSHEQHPKQVEFGILLL